MAEFPRIELTVAVARHGRLLPCDQVQQDTDAIYRAIACYDQLVDRLLHERTESSITIGNLRERLRAVDPQFPL